MIFSTKASSRWLASAFTLALAGCAQGAGNALPELTTYSTKFQQELKAELPKVRECCPKTNEFIKDSIKTRQKIRAGTSIQQQKSGGVFPNLFKRRVDDQ